MKKPKPKRYRHNAFDYSLYVHPTKGYRGDGTTPRKTNRRRKVRTYRRQKRIGAIYE